MTGKELLLVFAGTVAVSGAGGVGAAMVAKGGSGGETGGDEQILARLDALQESIDGTNDLITQNDESVRRLGRKVSTLERGIHTAPPAHSPRGPASSDGGHATYDSSKRMTVDTDVRTEIDGDAVEIGTVIEDADEMHKVLDDAMKKAHEALGDQLGTAIRLGAGDGALSVALGGFAKSMELRRLPEDERWEKARDEVGLNDVQIDELQSAISERDEAMKEAMNVEESDGDTGGHFTIKRMDFSKAREANTAYRKRVDNTLNDQQKKDWREKGYDGAFGNSSSGGAGVISISTFTESSKDSSDESHEE